MIGDEEDAAADDVGDDDGGRVERAEPALERGVVGGRRHARGACVTSR